MNDQICRISLFGGQARAVAAITTNIARTASEIHQCAPTAAAALGRALTGTLLLSSTLKNENDSLTLTIKGGGPIGSIVCVGGADGVVKGYVDHPAVDPPRARQGKLDVGAAVGKNGSMLVMKDLGLKEPFIGHCGLVSGEIGEDIAQYLLTSEQTPSLVALGVLCAEKEILGAGGVMLQPMPGCSEEALDMLESQAPFFENLSRNCAGVDSIDDFIAASLIGLPYEILEYADIRFHCRCERARIERVLLSLGKEELTDMIERDGCAQVGCQFCNRQYDFTKADLKALLREGEGAL